MGLLFLFIIMHKSFQPLYHNTTDITKVDRCLSDIN